MTLIASRELRNDTAGVLRRAAGGESIEITVRGKAVARISRIEEGRSVWTAKADLLDRLDGAQADPGLRDELRAWDEADDDLGPIG